MRTTVSLLMISLLLAASAPACAAGDAAKGEAKSSICAACHGVTGVSKQDIWPNLAGQKSGYIADQLRKYQSGTRKDTVMEAMAKILTDQDMANLAAYFEQQTPAEPQALGKPTAAVTHERREVD